MDKYCGLIERINEVTNRLQVEKFKEYYLCYNIFADDKGTKSASIWRSDGTFQMHNATRKDGKYDTRYSLIEWIRELGCEDVYVRWICERENITTMLMQHFEKVISKKFISMN